jgi:hypothetical protein
MNKHTEKSDPKNPPACGLKSNLLTSWGVIAALLGVGALPCPDCGMPMAWHLWPLALLILAGRWIESRRKRIPPDKPASKPPDDSEEPQESA